MLIRIKKYRFNAPAGEGGDPGAGGNADTSAGATGNDTLVGSDTAQGASGQDTLSGSEQAADTSKTDYIPEKFRVLKEDKTVDQEASARKMAESYAALEKFTSDKNGLKEGDARLSPIPETSEAYELTPPAGYEEVFTKDDPLLKDALVNFHGLNLTQAQVDGVLSQYYKVAPQLMEANAEIDGADVVKNLQATVWKTEAEMKENMVGAYKASSSLAEKIGMKFEDLQAAKLDNNPVFIRLMAALNKEMGEGKPPIDAQSSGTGMSAINSDLEYKALLASPEYLDGKHANHGIALSRAKAWIDKQHPPGKD